MKYFIVDAFTREAFGGNPAGVVLLDQDFPDERLMTQVAAELRYSETAFVQHNGPKEYTVRYFTPTGEVDLCGHATISTFGVLREQGLIADGDVCLNHTLAGDLEVAIGEQVIDRDVCIAGVGNLNASRGVRSDVLRSGLNGDDRASASPHGLFQQAASPCPFVLLCVRRQAWCCL